MGKSIYNWAELKAEYLKQDVKEARTWFRIKYGLPEGKNPTNTQIQCMKGWAQDWQKNQDAISKKAITIFGRDKAKRLAAALENIQGFFEAKALEKNLRVDDAEKVWKILRVENGLPSTIAKNVVTVPEDPEDTLDTLQDDNDRSSTGEDPEEI